MSRDHGSSEPPAVATASVSERMDAIDGLRGLAILSVIAWRYVFCALPRTTDSQVVAALRTLLWLSYSGVDLFFVVSGFLIGRILFEVRDSPRYYRTFYARRALRILPLYALVVAIALGLRALHPVRLAWLLGGATPPWWAYGLFLQTVWMVQHEAFGMNALGLPRQWDVLRQRVQRGLRSLRSGWTRGSLPATRSWDGVYRQFPLLGKLHDLSDELLL